MSSDNCDDCKDFERELEHAKIQIQTFDKLVAAQKDQIDSLKEGEGRDRQETLKVFVQMQQSTMELNARLLKLIETLAVAPKK